MSNKLFLAYVVLGAMRVIIRAIERGSDVTEEEKEKALSGAERTHSDIQNSPDTS